MKKECNKNKKQRPPKNLQPKNKTPQIQKVKYHRRSEQYDKKYSVISTFLGNSKYIKLNKRTL